ncbi:non-homologous end-joining DNA ligase [Amycolatopsis granulosa]|uniref:non-homologous end-joining DNA ligase n=1 Tax=Amycolatopsis granulosa TaxID=185684 RepID=UPI001422B801|nr:non-homologous end-joining DNA ligase [Amycolatopsis granulosa]NIH86032.1 DNA ligase D-like protein (predicted ligase) [Amycolatopsis granulosa]
MADPGWRAPMLATLTQQPFSRENWLFERKLDGVRAICARDGSAPVLWSRNHNDISSGYPELGEALADRGASSFVADGEIVAFDGKQTSFARLQQRIHLADRRRIEATGVAVYLYLFDLLAFDHQDTTGLPLRQRKQLLRRAFDWGGPLRYANHRNTSGEEYFGYACAHGWEGVIAKRADAPYRSGRTTDWLKFKCVKEQEFVVGGFSAPGGARTGFGALLVGYHERGRLRYAGKVGAGYTETTLRELIERLTALERPRSPFGERVPERGPRWVAPELVVQVRFSEWTGDGKLRHPRFLGVRDDKPAAEVVREQP